MNEVPGNMISLIPNNGTEFSVKAGQKVIFEVPPDVGFVKGRDSYLSFDVLNDGLERMGFNNTAGAQSLINRIDIYSLKMGTHLETLENINQWCGIENQYFYEDTTNLTSLEGCGKKVTAQSVTSTTGNGNLEANGLSTASVADTLLSPIKKDGTAVYGFRRYTIPLRAGIFRWWDDERLCPVIALGGLRIVLTLEDPAVAFTRLKPSISRVMEKDNFLITQSLQVDTPNDGTLITAGYLFFQSGKEVEEDATYPAGRAVAETGLIKGEQLQFYSADHATLADSHTAVINELTNCGFDLAASQSKFAADDLLTAADPHTSLTITGTTGAELVARGLVKGSVIEITGAGATSGNVAGAAFMVAADPTGSPNATIDIVPTNNGTVLSAANYGYVGNLTNVQVKIVPGCIIKLASGDATHVGDEFWHANHGQAWSPSAKVRPEFKVLSIVPPNLDMSKGMNYQFTSYDLFLNTLPSASTKHQVEVPSVATRAVAFNTNYVRTGSEKDAGGSGYFACEAPSQTKLNEVQYYINNKLYPVRSYDPRALAERVINQNENVKALSTINKEPKALGDAEGANLTNYTNSYLHSRELAREDFVYNLRDAEPQIRLGFSGGRSAGDTAVIPGNRTIFTRVWSKKIISMTEAGLSVML